MRGCGGFVVNNLSLPGAYRERTLSDGDASVPSREYMPIRGLQNKAPAAGAPNTRAKTAGAIDLPEIAIQLG
jgi:hypothetical protein